jgi:hypothetical protein
MDSSGTQEAGRPGNGLGFKTATKLQPPTSNIQRNLKMPNSKHRLNSLEFQEPAQRECAYEPKTQAEKNYFQGTQKGGGQETVSDLAARPKLQAPSPNIQRNLKGPNSKHRPTRLGLQ